LKRTEKKTLAKIINYGNDILTVHYHHVWQNVICIHVVLLEWKIWKQTVMSRMNRARHVFWCKQKLS